MTLPSCLCQSRGSNKTESFFYMSFAERWPDLTARSSFTPAVLPQSSVPRGTCDTCLFCTVTGSLSVSEFSEAPSGNPRIQHTHIPVARGSCPVASTCSGSGGPLVAVPHCGPSAPVAPERTVPKLSPTSALSAVLIQSSHLHSSSPKTQGDLDTVPVSGCTGWRNKATQGPGESLGSPAAGGGADLTSPQWEASQTPLLGRVGC